ncbi:23781_t:CDS:2, partial [Gigaspora margarita]
QTYKFEVNPMTCQGCSNSIEKALKKLEGVDYTINLENKTVEVKTAKFTADELVQTMKGIGKEAVLL